MRVLLLLESKKEQETRGGEKQDHVDEGEDDDDNFAEPTLWGLIGLGKTVDLRPDLPTKRHLHAVVLHCKPASRFTYKTTFARRRFAL